MNKGKDSPVNQQTQQIYGYICNALIRIWRLSIQYDDIFKTIKKII